MSNPAEPEIIEKEEKQEVIKAPKKKKINLRAGKNKQERSYCDTNDLLRFASAAAQKYSESNSKASQIDAEKMRKKQLAEQLKEERHQARMERKAKQEELLKAKVNANLSEKKKIKQQLRDIRKKSYSK